jgi:methyl-accepting chemotaxis protein
MNTRKRLSIKIVRFLGLGTLVSVIAVGTFVGYSQVSKMESRLRNMTQRHWAEFRQVDELLAGFVSIRAQLTDLVVQEGENVDPIVKEEKALLERSGALAAELSDDEDRILLENFTQKLKQHRVAMIAYAQELSMGRTGEGVRSWEATLLELENDAHQGISDLKGRISDRVQMLEAEALRSGKASRKLIVILGSLGLLMGMVILFVLQRALARPIAELCQITEAVADGDLTQRITRRSSDDIGTLTVAIGQMTGGLKDMVGDIQSAVLKVAEVAHGVEFYTGEVSREADVQSEVVQSANLAVQAMDALVEEVNKQFSDLAVALDDSSSSNLELKASIDEVSSYSDGLATEVEKITSSLVEMSASMGENLDLLNSLSSASEQTAQTARGLTATAREAGESARASRDLAESVTSLAREQGSEALTEMAKITRRNKETVDSYSEVIRSLGERSRNVGEVLDVIRSMADQTGLLSINASIIAAQAGEHGKGFAVVAEEVGKLADSTSSSVHRVEEVIQSVQRDVEKAVKLVDDVARGADQGISAAEKAGQVFREIEESSSESARHTREIADSTLQQAERSDEILHVVTRNLEEVMRIQEAMGEQKAGGDLVVKSAEFIRDTSLKLKESTEEQARESAVITKAVVDLNQFAGKVSQAMDGEKEAVGEMVSGLARIAEATGVINGSLGALKSLVADLGSLADQLGPTVARFRLGEEEVEDQPIPAADENSEEQEL